MRCRTGRTRLEHAELSVDMVYASPSGSIVDSNACRRRIMAEDVYKPSLGDREEPTRVGVRWGAARDDECGGEEGLETGKRAQGGGHDKRRQAWERE